MAGSRAVRVALLGVEDGPEGIHWTDGALDRVARVLQGELRGPGAAEVLDEVLRLAAALRKRSPTAADALLGAVRTLPEAVALVEGPKPGASIDRVRCFTASEGRRVAVRAPSTRESPPNGAIPLKSLVDPTGADRARVRSRARKEAKHGCSQ